MKNDQIKRLAALYEAVVRLSVPAEFPRAIVRVMLAAHRAARLEVAC